MTCLSLNETPHDSTEIIRICEDNQRILAAYNNTSRIPDCRAGTQTDLSASGFISKTQTVQGIWTTSHQLMGLVANLLLKYEPHYALDARHYDFSSCD